MKIEHSTEINADIGTVWALTRDVERWPDITPTMTAVEPLDTGPPEVGRRYRITQPGQRPRVWTVRRIEEPTVFTWDTSLGPMVMSGQHRIEPTDGGCRNVLTIELTGFGSRLFGLVAGPMVRKALATENHGFKQAAEATGAQSNAT